jgi:hypothetical protein
LGIDTEMSWCIQSPMTRWQSVRVTNFHHPWDTRNMHSQSYRVPLSRTQQRKASFFPCTIVDWNHLPQTAVLSDSLPVLYILIFLNLHVFSYYFFFFRNSIPLT